MGLFDKKFCDVCGDKIGLLGNRKLEDGNLCKNCAKKLSPWFDERRHSTVEQIKKQLAYREENRAQATAFNITRTFGKGSTKLYIDDNARKFAVNRGNDFASSNPDILDFTQANGCDLEIRENRSELHRTVDGKSVSYNPPRYEYSYDFKVTIRVSHPYFDDMRFELNSGSVRTGEQRMTGGNTGAWRVSSIGTSFSDRRNIEEYNDLVQMGDELKATVESWRGGGMTNTAFGAGAFQNAAFGTAAVQGAAFGAGAFQNAAYGAAQQGAAFGAAAQKTTAVHFGSQAPVPYPENINGSNMFLEVKFYGTAEVEVCNPAAAQSYGGIDALKNVLGTELTTATGNAVSRCGQQGVPVAMLSAQVMGIANAAKAELESRWMSQYGLNLQSVAVASVSLTAESQAKYDEIKRIQMAQAPYQQPVQQTAYQQPMQQTAGWTCPYCGAQNTGKFCVSCGARREG